MSRLNYLNSRNIHCNYCGKPAQLVTGATLYPHRADLAHRKFWQCVPCDAYVGTHQSDRYAVPLGRLANAELRAAKRAAHNAFDALWQHGGVSRSKAYSLLAKELGIHPRDCHIGMFTPEQCNAVTKAVARITARLNRTPP